MHQHNHGNHARLGNRLRLTILLTAIILVAEVFGGYLANSLALLSDAGHVFTDLLALSLSWFGVQQAGRPPSRRMTFGYHRIGLLIALVNSATLVLIAVVIFYEAYQRFQSPPEVKSGLMLAVGLVGLAVNLFVIFYLRPDSRENLNVRSAFLHAFGDALASVGVVTAAVVIGLTGWAWFDPAVSVAIGLIIAISPLSIVREALRVFLEATPRHLNVEEVADAITDVPGVRAVHDLHLWSIAPTMHALSCHVMVEEEAPQRPQIVATINQLLAERFDIGHTTLQTECVECEPGHLYCTFSPGGLDGDSETVESEG